MLRTIKLFLVLLAACVLAGCSMRAVDDLYCLPRRSQEYNDLQNAMDSAMAGRSFSAPLAGENQQTVQTADLDGDGALEYLVFARDTSAMPLQILIFRQEEDRYVLSDAISSYGTSFDRVEYVQMDREPGLELVVGCSLSNDVPRAVSVYTFSSGAPRQVLSAGYSKLLTCDLNGDGVDVLFLIRPGEKENGVAELYAMEDGEMHHAGSAPMSAPAENLRRLITGNLSDGTAAVFAACSMEDGALVTDVFTMASGSMANISLSPGPQISRSYPVYAEDIDGDGVMELPELLTDSLEGTREDSRQFLIRWYALDTAGNRTTKAFTFHDFADGWYLDLDPDLSTRLTGVWQEDQVEFYLQDGEEPVKLFTLYAFTGRDREEEATQGNRFVLYRTDTVTYAAYLETASGNLNMTPQDLIDSFRLIHQGWYTGET